MAPLATYLSPLTTHPYLIILSKKCERGYYGEKSVSG